MRLPKTMTRYAEDTDSIYFLTQKMNMVESVIAQAILFAGCNPSILNLTGRQVLEDGGIQFGDSLYPLTNTLYQLIQRRGGGLLFVNPRGKPLSASEAALMLRRQLQFAGAVPGLNVWDDLKTIHVYVRQAGLQPVPILDRKDPAVRRLAEAVGLVWEGSVVEEPEEEEVEEVEDVELIQGSESSEERDEQLRLVRDALSRMRAEKQPLDEGAKRNWISQAPGLRSAGTNTEDTAPSIASWFESREQYDLSLRIRILLMMFGLSEKKSLDWSDQETLSVEDDSVASYIRENSEFLEESSRNLLRKEAASLYGEEDPVKFRVTRLRELASELLLYLEQ